MPQIPVASAARGHSSLSRPLNDSINALPVGFPGRLKSSVTPFQYAHQSNDFEMNSEPLSTRIVSGQVPRCWLTRSRASTTWSPVIRRPTSIARLSRLKSSTNVKIRMR